MTEAEKSERERLAAEAFAVSGLERKHQLAFEEGFRAGLREAQRSGQGPPNGEKSQAFRN